MKVKSKTNRLSRNNLLIFIITFAFLGGLVILLTKAATPGTPSFGLYVAPSTSNVAAGQQFSVTVNANLGTTSGIQSIASYLRYDTTMLRLDAANQSGVNPNFTVTSRCTNLDGCKPAGEIVFVAGYGGTGTIPPSDGILLGNLTFTALKTGTAALTFDPSATLSGFTSQTVSQTTLNSRTLLNGSYTLTDGTAPTPAPVLSSLSKSVTTVSLSWTGSTDEQGGSGLAGYKIYRGGTEVGSTNATTTTYTDQNLSSNTAYSYTVKAYDNAGNYSAASNTLSVTTVQDVTAPTVPGKPTVTLSTGSPQNASLSWTGSTDTNGSGVDYYVIYKNGTQIATSPSLTYTDSNLPAGTSITYTIAARDKAGNISAQSASTTVTTVDTQAPTVPGNFTVTSPNSTSAALTWSASTDNVGVTGYEVYRNGTKITTTATNVTSYNDSNLTPGTYSYTVKAIDAANNASAATASKSITLYSSYDPSKDGVVGVADLNLVLSNYGKTGANSADVNGDGVVNILDISGLLTRWGTAG